MTGVPAWREVRESQATPYRPTEGMRFIQIFMETCWQFLRQEVPWSDLDVKGLCGE
jgi:hypothetical protein